MGSASVLALVAVVVVVPLSVLTGGLMTGPGRRPAHHILESHCHTSLATAWMVVLAAAVVQGCVGRILACRQLVVGFCLLAGRPMPSVRRVSRMEEFVARDERGRVPNRPLKLTAGSVTSLAGASAAP